VLEPNAQVHSAALVLSCSLIALDFAQVYFILDVVLLDCNADIICILILWFNNSHAHLLGCLLQLHRIVLRARSRVTNVYERVGYFLNPA